MKSYNNYAISVAATIVALLFVAVVAVAGETSAAVEETTQATSNGDDKLAVSEKPIKLVHVLNPGEREYLSPNLIGLQNIAMTYLPLSLNFINIIDAFREIVNGVRYEIILNAQNNDNTTATELVCRLVILEKPWLRTEWGDKYRELQHNNCTMTAGADDGTGDSLADATSISEDIERHGKILNDKNTAETVYYGGTRNELTTSDVSKLESQIITTTSHQLKQQQPPQQQQEEQKVEEELQTNIEGDDAMVSTGELLTTNVPPELNDNEKKWLDDILSLGALNFEQMLKNQQNKLNVQNEETVSSNKENNEPQLLVLRNANNDNNYNNENENIERKMQEVGIAQETEIVAPQAEQHENLRVKRNHITGGQKELDHKEAEDRLNKVLTKLSAGDGPTYKIKKINSATTQVVSGSLTRLNAVLLNSDSAEEECNVEIWSQPWLPNSDEITMDCGNKATLKKRLRRSTEHNEKKHWHKKRNHHSLDKTEHLFNKFQSKFKRHYVSSTERQMRLRIFKENLKTIGELNKHEMGSAKYGITEFADMTSSEYKMRTGLWEREPQRASKNTIAKIPNIELPKEFDWREKGAISPVKNQGNCGSCWAFSVTGNLEGLHAVKTGVLEEYSEQELLDCDTVDSACNGGLPDNAYEAIESIGGLELENEYPYKARKAHCQFNKTMAHIKVKGHVDLPKNETAMAQWLLVNGPISIGINANAMQFYRGGVSHPWKHLCSHSNLDHGVLIVGYGVSEYPSFKKILPYWIVKNSWGPKWGEQGYYRVYRGDNSCGVSEMATSAVLAD